MNKKIILAIIILIAIGLGFLYLSYGPQPGPSEQPIQPEQPIEQPELKKVFVKGTNFATEDGDFRFIGALTAPRLRFLAYNTYFTDWKQETDEYMESYVRSFKDAGPLVMRFFAFGRYEMDDPRSEYGKKYAEPNWERLDYIVNKAEKEGIYLIWTLWDYWTYGEEGYPRYPYWDDRDIKPAIEAMVTRYKDRNVIMAWEIINEGDVREMWHPETYEPILRWIDNISTFIKSIDPDGIVSTGFGVDPRTPYFEAGGATREYKGIRKFIEEVHSLPNIDFIPVHIYGGNVDAMTNPSYYTDTWRQQVRWHVKEGAKLGAKLGKPVLAAEWGTQRQIGEELRRQVYQYMVDLFVEYKMDSVFNGWGPFKEPPEVVDVYSDDAELVAILREGMERIKR